jgi:prophage regulatory protein
MDEAILRLPDVKRRVGLSRSSIYARVASGDFPKPVRLGANARAVGFLESEVDNWLIRQAERRTPAETEQAA